MPPATCKEIGERPTAVTKESNCVEYAIGQDRNRYSIPCKDLDHWSVSVLTTYFFDTLAPFLEKKILYDEEAIHLAKQYLETMEAHFRVYRSTRYLLQRAEKEPKWIPVFGYESKQYSSRPCGQFLDKFNIIVLLSL